jgi:hypothetical protein
MRLRISIARRIFAIMITIELPKKEGRWNGEIWSLELYVDRIYK